MKYLFFVLTTFLIATPIIVHAQIFANDISGVNPSTSNPFTVSQVTDINVSATGVSRGGGVLAFAEPDAYTARNWTDAVNIDPLDYFSFTMTALGAYKMSFGAFTFEGTSNGESGPGQFVLRSSLDNFTTNIGPVMTNIYGGTVDLSGAAFQSLAGTITFRLYAFDSNNANAPFGLANFSFSGNVSLPVELKDFTVTSVGQSTMLDFSTASERNNDYFDIERSADGLFYVSIGQVEGVGNSNSLKSYRFEDKKPLSGTNYYRLKQVDTDGTFDYSSVVSINMGLAGTIRLSPMPATHNMRLVLDTPVAESAVWEVIDLSGRLILTGQIEAESSEANIPVSFLTSGMYIVRLVHGQSVEVKQFVKE